MPVTINGLGDVTDPNPDDPNVNPNANYIVVLKSEFDSLVAVVQSIQQQLGQSGQSDYFNLAATFVTTLKANTANYPNTMRSLRTNDDTLIANNGYALAVTDQDKANILIAAVRANLNI